MQCFGQMSNHLLIEDYESNYFEIWESRFLHDNCSFLARDRSLRGTQGNCMPIHLIKSCGQSYFIPEYTHIYCFRRCINPDPKCSSLKSSFVSLNILVTHLSESFFRTPLAVLVHTCREKTILYIVLYYTIAMSFNDAVTLFIWF